MHEFQERLDFSNSYSNAPWWEELYRGFFGKQFTGMTLVEGSTEQRAGIDRIVTLSCDRVVTVDEKVRARDYNDFALERWSDQEKRKPGWIQKDLFCDYIAYAFIPSRRCYLLPTLDLQRAWRRCGRLWVKEYRSILAQNNGYVTECIVVPIDEVLRAMQSGALLTWKETPERKPIVSAEPAVNGYPFLQRRGELS